MREVVILSGKGGTGKTSLTASFAALAGRAVLADCDVDAADLHLVLPPRVREVHEFRAGKEAVIAEDRCTGCGICFSACRFNALEGYRSADGIRRYRVLPMACEGCGVCALLCPKSAVTLDQPVCGEWFISETRFGPMVHARLRPGQENSGKLVAEVRAAARRLAAAAGERLILSDGPPGIGCPVIASLSGSSHVVAVCEPTVAGGHDLKRVAALASHFGMRISVVVNRADINPQKTVEIRSLAREGEMLWLGEIPYDPAVTRAQINALPVVQHDPDSPAARAIRSIWEKLCIALENTAPATPASRSPKQDFTEKGAD